MMNVSKDDLLDLRQRFQILDLDRKTYYERSMATMKENKVLIEEMKENNKKMRKALAFEVQSKRNTPAKAGKRPVDKLTALEENVVSLRKNYDSVKATAEQRRDLLTKLEKQLNALETQGSATVSNNDPMTSKIRALENRLEKAVLKHNEALNVAKTYEDMIKRFEEDQIGYDTQIKTLRDSRAAKEQDCKELNNLVNQAQLAFESASQDLVKKTKKAEDERNFMQNVLEDKKNELAQIVSSNNSLAGCEIYSENILEDELMAKYEQSLIDTAIGETEVVGSEERAAKLRRAFEEIKEQSGIVDVVEIVQAMETQYNMIRHFEEREAGFKKQMNALKVEKGQMLEILEACKSKAERDREIRNQQLEEKQEEINHHEANIESSIANSEKLDILLSDVLDVVIPLARSCNIDDDPSLDSLVELIVQCERALTEAVNKITTKEIEKTAAEAVST